MNTNTGELKGLLVGCGFMGGMHAQVYKTLPKVSLVAAVDQEIEASTKKLVEIGFSVPVYDCLEEALSKEDVDFVDVCLPTHLHRASAVTAIEAGKALFCEKPLALTLEDADVMLAAASKKNTPAQVGHCIRFWPEYQALQAYHESGEGGRLLSLTLTRLAGRPGYGAGDWLNDERKSGGAAVDLHIHDTDLVLALLGQPDEVTSRVSEDYSGPSHIFSVMNFDGTTVALEGGWNYPADWGFRMAFQAVYENSVIDYDSSSEKPMTICESGSPPRSFPVKRPETGSSNTSEGNISDLGGYFNQLAYFTDCLLKGRQPEIATLVDGRASLALTLREIEIARQTAEK